MMETLGLIFIHPDVAPKGAAAPGAVLPADLVLKGAHQTRTRRLKCLVEVRQVSDGIRGMAQVLEVVDHAGEALVLPFVAISASATDEMMAVLSA